MRLETPETVPSPAIVFSLVTTSQPHLGKHRPTACRQHTVPFLRPLCMGSRHTSGIQELLSVCRLACWKPKCVSAFASSAVEPAADGRASPEAVAEKLRTRKRGNQQGGVMLALIFIWIACCEECECIMIACRGLRRRTVVPRQVCRTVPMMSWHACTGCLDA